MTPLEKKQKIQEKLHKRMVQTYGEDYANKTNAIKDASTPSAMSASKPLNKTNGLIKARPKPKVFKGKFNSRCLKIPISFDIPIYLDDDEKNLTLNEIKNRLDEMDSMELVDLVFSAMDYKNVIMDR